MSNDTNKPNNAGQQCGNQNMQKQQNPANAGEQCCGQNMDSKQKPTAEADKRRYNTETDQDGAEGGKQISMEGNKQQNTPRLHENPANDSGGSNPDQHRQPVAGKAQPIGTKAQNQNRTGGEKDTDEDVVLDPARGPSANTAGNKPGSNRDSSGGGSSNR